MDPFAFAQAIATALALILAPTPVTEAVPVPTAEVVEDSTFNGVIVNPFDLDWVSLESMESETVTIEGLTWSLGWIVSSVSGRMVCVTAAPCEDDLHYRGPQDSSWNYITGVEN